MKKIISALMCLGISNFLHANIDPLAYDENTSQIQFAQSMDLLSTITLQGNEKILNFGCRSGKQTIWLAQQLPKGKVLAIDHDAAMLSFTQKQVQTNKLSNVLCLQYPPTNLNFYQNQFDYVCSFAYLHWIGNYQSNFELMYRSLKPNGTALMQIGISDDVGRTVPFQCHIDAIASRARWKEYFTNLSSSWYYPLDLETAEALLQEIGFTSVSGTYVKQIATFATTEDLAHWILTWSPHAAQLPHDLALYFATEVAERYDATCTHNEQGAIILERPALEIRAEKNMSPKESIISLPEENERTFYNEKDHDEQ